MEQHTSCSIIHPFKLIPVLVSMGCIVFLLMYAATVVPSLSYISCGLIGIGMVPCQMLPLYGMVILVIVYMQVEPFFLFTLRKRIADDTITQAEEAEIALEATADPLDVLSPKEKEVAELICLGYTNKYIAKVLFISEHTVKDHTKKIYPKTGVHSRFELATLVNKERSSNKQRNI